MLWRVLISAKVKEYGHDVDDLLIIIHASFKRLLRVNTDDKIFEIVG